MKLISCSNCGAVYDWDILYKNYKDESKIYTIIGNKIYFQCRSCYYRNNVLDCNRSIRIEVK